MDELEESFEPVRVIARSLGLPGLEEGLSWGTPGLKVRGKMILRIREPDVLVLHCDPAEKEILMQMAPEVFFQTDHYRAAPYILARISTIDPEDLASRIEKTWRALAGKKLLQQHTTP